MKKAFVDCIMAVCQRTERSRSYPTVVVSVVTRRVCHFFYIYSLCQWCNKKEPLGLGEANGKRHGSKAHERRKDTIEVFYDAGAVDSNSVILLYNSFTPILPYKLRCHSV